MTYKDIFSRYDNSSAPPKPLWVVEEDMHLHTTASDGNLSPEDLVERAADANMKIIAITDHDTTEGLVRAAKTALSRGITLIPGVELSTELDNGSEVHLIGLFIRHDDDDLQGILRNLAEERIKAARSTVEKLESIGLKLSWERVRELAKGVVGRPHIAKAMLEKGYVQSIQEAFDRYLGDGQTARVARTRVTTIAGIDIIHNAGGVAVVAHPRTVKDLELYIRELKEAGLDGIEVYAEKYMVEHQDYYLDLSKNYGLIASGGSDYHAFGHQNEVDIGMSGPPRNTARAFLERARAMHGSKAGSVLTGTV